MADYVEVLYDLKNQYNAQDSAVIGFGGSLGEIPVRMWETTQLGGVPLLCKPSILFLIAQYLFLSSTDNIMWTWALGELYMIVIQGACIVHGCEWSTHMFSMGSLLLLRPSGHSWERYWVIVFFQRTRQVQSLHHWHSYQYAYLTIPVMYVPVGIQIWDIYAALIGAVRCALEHMGDVVKADEMWCDLHFFFELHPGSSISVLFLGLIGSTMHSQWICKKSYLWLYTRCRICSWMCSKFQEILVDNPENVQEKERWAKSLFIFWLVVDSIWG